MTPTNCPTEDVIRRFASGQVSVERAEDLADHFADCARCEETLAKFDRDSDDLLLSLQHSRLASPSVSLEQVIPSELAAAMTRIPSSSLRSSGSNMTVDPGRKYAKRLANGPVMIGRFELLRELGTGSFGYVFQAKDTELDRVVALKLQRAGDMASEEDVARFLREARSVAQLSHSGIVALYESGQTDEGVCFLVTEYVEGDTLEASTSVSPDYRLVVEQISGLAEALHYAHRQGIIHRDIKPSNILIDQEGRPHLMDFGLALWESGDATLTSDGRIMGTPAYMSPEQARGDSHLVDARTDVYSLGVVMYEQLTGSRPFYGNRRMLLLHVLEHDPRPLRQLNDTIPRDLETICLKAMSRNPSRRYQSAQELADDLQRYLSGTPVVARPIGNSERLWRWCARYPFATLLFVALVVGAATGFAHLSNLSTWFVHSTALESVRMDATMIEEINKYYSDVIDRSKVREFGVAVTHEYMSKIHSLPLPATFTIDAGQRISQSECGLQVRMYSRFPWRKDGGPKTDFERQALRVLEDRAAQKSAELTWHEFRTESGQRWLYFAKAQIMQQSCIDCHNEDPQSPRRNWQKGDLGGVLLLSRPLDRDIAVTKDGLRGAFNLMATVVATLGIIGLAFVFRNRLVSKNLPDSNSD